MSQRSRTQEPTSIHSASGDELLVENGSPDKQEGSETIVASDKEGSSLTLLEEYSMRKSKVGPVEFTVALASAAASLAFAALIYIKTI